MVSSMMMLRRSGFLFKLLLLLLMAVAALVVTIWLMDFRLNRHWLLHRHQQQTKTNYIRKSNNQVLISWTDKAAVEENTSNSNDNRIFFHETSGKMELSLKMTCAIESAAVHNPQRPVQIFFQPQQQSTTTTTTSSIDQSSAWFRALSHYDNVQLIVIDDEELYFKDSPLEDWYRRGEWRLSPYRMQHMSDYIRILSLYKEGGMYLDLDVLTLKPYDSYFFRNFLTFPQTPAGNFPNGMVHLNRGHRLIDELIQIQTAEYNSDDYMFNGPGTVSAACERIWGKRLFSLDDNESIISLTINYNNGDITDNNNVVHFLPHKFFFPINNDQMMAIFYSYSSSSSINCSSSSPAYDVVVDSDTISLIEQQIEDSRTFGLHLTGFVRNCRLDIANHQQQLFARLAANHCPITFSLAHLFQWH